MPEKPGVQSSTHARVVPPESVLEASGLLISYFVICWPPPMLTQSSPTTAGADDVSCAMSSSTLPSQSLSTLSQASGAAVWPGNELSQIGAASASFGSQM